MKLWQEKAHRIIANACRASYEQANTKADGTRYKRHVPYTVPQVAEDLIACLNRDNEAQAKALFFSYDGEKFSF